MRVGLTCSTIEPALTQGKIDGIGVYTKVLFEKLAQLQHDVVPFSFPKLKNWPRTSDFTDGEILPLPYTVATLASLLNLPTNNIGKKLDLLHITDHMIPRTKRVPTIATIHDGLMFTHPQWYPSKLRPVKNWLRKKTFQWINHFITISHAMVPELVNNMGIPENKISVVYNGIQPIWHEIIPLATRQQVLKTLHLPEKFILFAGTLQPKKNVTRMINAFLALPLDIQREYPFVIVGKAGWGATETLSAIEKLTAAGTGYWLDYIGFSELQALYQSTTLYVCPSLHEGFGYTTLEAQASKVPVLTSNISALPEIAGDAAYLVDPYSEAEIKQAMQQLLTNESLRHHLIQKGCERVKAFSLEKCVQQTIDVYKTVLR